MDTSDPALASRVCSCHSQLFMVRVWLEDLGVDCIEWRGQVQHVASGQVRYFRDWPGLCACVQEMLESYMRRSAAILSSGMEPEEKASTTSVTSVTFD